MGWQCRLLGSWGGEGREINYQSNVFSFLVASYLYRREEHTLSLGSAAQ